MVIVELKDCIKRVYGMQSKSTKTFHMLDFNNKPIKDNIYSKYETWDEVYNVLSNQPNILVKKIEL